MTTVRILGSRAREQVPGTSIRLLAPGFRGSLTQRLPGVATAATFDLPFAEAGAGAEVMLAAQLTVELEARQSASPGLRSRSAVVAYPRVIVPRRPGIAYALLQTDETGTSSIVLPLPGDDCEAVFALSIAAVGTTRRTLRVLMWPEAGSSVLEPLAVATRWERTRRPNQLAQRGVGGEWRPADASALAAGPVLLLLHDTFSTAQATFPEWLDHADFSPLAATFGDRCLAFTHPTLATGIEENLAWLVERLASLPGPVDIVAHGRGGLLARALAADGRLPLRRICQVGTPNQGTVLAGEAQLPRFLDAHLAMLAHLPVAVAQGTLEGVLCMARVLAQGRHPALPGVQALTPERAAHPALAEYQVAGQRWFTIGARFMAPEKTLDLGDDFEAAPNDLVVPTPGCHEPGILLTDSLRIAGVDTHHHNYFANPRVRERLAEWFG